MKSIKLIPIWLCYLYGQLFQSVASCCTILFLVEFVLKKHFIEEYQIDPNLTFALSFLSLFLYTAFQTELLQFCSSMLVYLSPKSMHSFNFSSNFMQAYLHCNITTSTLKDFNLRGEIYLLRVSHNFIKKNVSRDSVRLRQNLNTRP